MYDLETRKCKNRFCRNKFKTLLSSKQQFCSETCRVTCGGKKRKAMQDNISRWWNEKLARYKKRA